jgi:2-oxoglutarate ferredoxin oxidoreductase subunit delta
VYNQYFESPFSTVNIDLLFPVIDADRIFPDIPDLKAGTVSLKGISLVERRQKRIAHIIIESERCKGCRYCIAVCPVQIIGIAKNTNQLGTSPVEVIADKADLCTGCGTCALMCPDAAISVFSAE